MLDTVSIRTPQFLLVAGNSSSIAAATALSSSRACSSATPRPNRPTTRSSVFNLLVAYDWVDPDRDVIDDHSGRMQIGGQLTIIPGVSFDARVRRLNVATEEGDGTDLFLQMHLWF